jgi:hypothetical protein
MDESSARQSGYADSAVQEDFFLDTYITFGRRNAETLCRVSVNLFATARPIPDVPPVM